MPAIRVQSEDGNGSKGKNASNENPSVDDLSAANGGTTGTGDDVSVSLTPDSEVQVVAIGVGQAGIGTLARLAVTF